LNQPTVVLVVRHHTSRNGWRRARFVHWCFSLTGRAKSCDDPVLSMFEPFSRKYPASLAILALVCLLSAPACAQTPAAGNSGGKSSAQTAAAPVVAEVDGEPITALDVEKALGSNLDRLEQQVYQMKLRQIDRLIADKLLAREAARRGTTVEQLVSAEIEAKVAPVSSQDVDQFYEANKARLPQQGDIKSQIQRYLREQRLNERRDAFIDSLRGSSKVVVSLEPPAVTRATVSIDGAPFKGPANAPVTIVEFSDFHCPFCRRAKPTIAELLAKYPDKVKLVY
jgi:hypothetical protein